MIKLSDYRTEIALPAEMKTPERIALSYAYDQQKKKFIERLQRVYIWADLEKVDDNKLDFLAVENRVLFYNSDLMPDVKRELIRKSIYWHMKLGTRQAMEEMVNIVFQNDSSLTSIEEWYMYDGEPYHFRLLVDIETKQIYANAFLYYLHTIKNARSRFDYIGYIAKIRIALIETAAAPLIILKLSFPFWKNMRYLDGTWSLNGSNYLNGMRVPFIVNIVITCAVSTHESIHAFVTQKKNMRYLDGTDLLDGTILLNAKITEEVL